MPVEVTRTKYKVATPSTSGSRLVDVHLYQLVFSTTIDAMLYFEDFRNFNNLPWNARMLETGTKATNRTYIMSRKIALAEVRAGPVPRLAEKMPTIQPKFNRLILPVAVLYCMANAI